MDSCIARSLSSGAHSRDPLGRPGMTKKAPQNDGTDGRESRTSLRQKSNFFSPINADFSVQSCAQKYFALPVGQIISTTPRHPAPDRGALRGRHDSLARDAMDAVCRKTNDMTADGEGVWS